MKSWWSVVVGLWVLTGCAPEYDESNAWASLEHHQPVQKPTHISVTPGAVTFPRTSVGQPATASVVIHNEGDTLTRVYLGIPEPFTVASTSLNLPPGAEETVELRLEPATPGPTGAVLVVQTDDRRIEILVRGEVDPTPPSTGPQGVEEEKQASPTCSGPRGTARLAWSYLPPRERVLEFTGTVDAEGHLYATECPRWDPAEDGPIEQRVCDILSFDRDGHPRYRRPVPGTQYVQVDLIAGGRLYGTFERTSPRVTSLSAADGHVRWSTPLAPLLDARCTWAYVSAPVLAGPHLVVAVHAVGADVTCNALVALDADTGAVAWNLGSEARFSQPIADARGNLYTAHSDRTQDRSELLSYTADGHLRWKQDRAGERAPVAVAGGSLLLSAAELADPETGAARATLAIANIPRWRPEGELPFGPYPHANVALGAGGLLALPEARCTGAACPTAPHVSERFFYGLDTASGALRWTLPVGGYPSAPLLTARSSLLLVDRPVPEDCEFGCTGDDSYFDSYVREYTLDGHERVACRLQGQAPFITPPALHRGRLFLGAWLNWNIDSDETRLLGLHAYELGSPTEPASTGWVTEGGGNARLGHPL